MTTLLVGRIIMKFFSLFRSCMSIFLSSFILILVCEIYQETCPFLLDFQVLWSLLFCNMT